MSLARQVLSDIRSELCIDRRLVFATGYSNGGMLSQRLACEASDVFSAVASVAGVVALKPGGTEAIATCAAAYSKGKRATSVLDIHGTDDIAVPVGGNFLLGFPGVWDGMRAWAAGNGCGGPADAPGTGRGGEARKAWQTGNYTGYSWPNCNKGSLVELVTIAGGPHEWPNHEGFVATTAILDFFDRAASSRHGVAPPVRDAAVPPPAPNPTAEPVAPRAPRRAGTDSSSSSSSSVGSGKQGKGAKGSKSRDAAPPPTAAQPDSERAGTGGGSNVADWLTDEKLESFFASINTVDENSPFASEFERLSEEAVGPPPPGFDGVTPPAQVFEDNLDDALHKARRTMGMEDSGVPVLDPEIFKVEDKGRGKKGGSKGRKGKSKGKKQAQEDDLSDMGVDFQEMMQGLNALFALEDAVDDKVGPGAAAARRQQAAANVGVPDAVRQAVEEQGKPQYSAEDEEILAQFAAMFNAAAEDQGLPTGNSDAEVQAAAAAAAAARAEEHEREREREQQQRDRKQRAKTRAQAQPPSQAQGDNESVGDAADLEMLAQLLSGVGVGAGADGGAGAGGAEDPLAAMLNMGLGLGDGDGIEQQQRPQAASVKIDVLPPSPPPAAAE